jgi:histone demethylase JARID1
VEGLSHSSVSGALLNVLIDAVEWLRRALEGISRPCNSRRCKLTDIEDILTDYRVHVCVIFYCLFCYFKDL